MYIKLTEKNYEYLNKLSEELKLSKRFIIELSVELLKEHLDKNMELYKPKADDENEKK